MNVSPFKKGHSALILGGGPIGLAVIQALLARGADKIIVSEVSTRRSQFAKDFGAHYVVNPTKEELNKAVREINGGEGVDVVFDAAGVQAALDAAVLALKARGTYINIAVWKERATLVPNQFLFSQCTIFLRRGVFGLTTTRRTNIQRSSDLPGRGVSRSFRCHLIRYSRSSPLDFKRC